MKNKSFLWLTLAIATIVSLGCLVFLPDTSPDFSIAEPYDPPMDVPTATLLITDLPPLPDFEQMLTFGGAGGGGLENCPNLLTYTGPLPFVKGGLAFDAVSANILAYQNLPRLAFLCLWGFPADKPFEVSLISPDGKTSLNGGFSVLIDPDGWEELLWDDQKEKEVIYKVKDALATEINFWWPGNLEHGVWQVKVTWEDGDIVGDFDANLNMPQISLEDADVDGQIQPACRSIVNQSEYHVIGEGFPVNTPTYILLYERKPLLHEGAGKNYELVWNDTVLSDSTGRLRVTLPYEFKSAVSYQLIAVTDPTVDVSEQTYGGELNSVECFKAPIISTSSCPGAPLQRMAIGQLGYSCVKTDLLEIYETPAKSATTLDILSPGDAFLVTGGAQCADGWSWWQIETMWGTKGWIPEGGDEIDPYFICPSQ